MTGRTRLLKLFLLLAIVSVSLGTSCSKASAGVTKQPEACIESAKAQVQVVGSTSPALLARVEELQTLCHQQESQQKSSSSSRTPQLWIEPCDPRSTLPLDATYYVGNNSIHTAQFNSGEEREACRKATKYRCTWIQTSGTSKKEDAIPSSTNPIEHRPYYKIFYTLHCPTQPTGEDFILFESAFIPVSSGSPVRSHGDVRSRAISAAAQLRLPAPKPYLSLAAVNGVDYTVVNGYTWFSTDDDVMVQRSKRVDAGATWVEVFAVPVALGFMANGESVQWCNGPGDDLSVQNINTLWNSKKVRPFYHPAPAGCSKKFTRTSPGLPNQPVTGTMQIRWHISWVGSGNTEGTLPDMYSTATTIPFAITEAQTLVTR